MEFFEPVIAHYGWEGLALAGVILFMFGVQLCYYLFVYGRIPQYKDSKRPEIRTATPPVSVIVPLFGENYSFMEEILPLIVAQEYPDFEVVIVYVGRDTDFYDELVRIRQSFPQITATRIQMNPRFPISSKMALNIGIKSAHYEHLIFTTPDAYPTSDRWLSLMAGGFRRGDIVIGYCGLEPGKGAGRYLMRMRRMMDSVAWLSAAVGGRPYRATRQNYGFTKSLYFGANGFDHLNMNIGEDDLFLARLLPQSPVSVVLSPRAALREKCWGGMRWWTGTERYFGSAFPYYPLRARNAVQWETGSRTLFFLAVLTALAVMPWEFKAGAALLAIVRLAIVLIEVRRIGRRIGEEKVWGRYPLYDLWSPIYSLYMSLLRLRKDERVWR
ncbi:MAG: glycosyltransferase [Alistipes sp.]|nr:glycosyltransferase [Alistipes sp.]